MKPIFTVWKEFTFDAAHSLPHLPEGHKCRNMHGHTYRVRVECAGELDRRGFVVDYAEIAAAWKRIHERIDHQNLNEVLSGEIEYTTAEPLARWIALELIHGNLPVSRVVVQETATSGAEWTQ